MKTSKLIKNLGGAPMEGNSPDSDEYEENTFEAQDPGQEGNSSHPPPF